ncbi:MAG: 23S rRNA (guanosine(2251)-2'-O)-methyltransferase RlmB [Clostridiales bacterium]|nr:23S rRNA (guanosine(2251)-2'-O)-methyltransferase RlmB [Clostridiales bacterium]
MDDRIFGRNPVLEALKAGREVDKIMVSKDSKDGSIKKIIALAKEKKIVVQYVEKAKIKEISNSEAHQGVVALIAAYEYSTIEEILEKAALKNKTPFILVLDEINDPHNLGSIIRTAEAVGADGVIIGKRRSVGLTAVVAKTSAGALEYMPVAKVTNISQAIDTLKKAGLWVAGADLGGEKNHYESDLKGSIALVIGNEGKGISRLVKEKCDFLVKLPMDGQIASLNASVAAAVFMYEIYRQRNDM